MSREKPVTHGELIRHLRHFKGLKPIHSSSKNADQPTGVFKIRKCKSH